MNLTLHHHVHHHVELSRTDPVTAAILGDLTAILKRQELLMIDTSKLLAAVAAEKTESASLRALLAANTQAQKDSLVQIAALQAQLAAGTPITAEQLAALQADIDSASTDLSADNQAAADAIVANQLPQPAPAAPPAGQAAISPDGPAS